ncbi:MAG: response regulator [Alphaproteobacteria bacterium]|nr:MAG: response regulator [Alphaproteobacteria bacterium]
MNFLNDKTVLAIDDAPAIRTFLRISLTIRGAEFYEAATAREGLDLCRTRTPDVVVLDLGLPDEDGLEILPRIKAARADNPPIVVVLTVRDDRRTREVATERGADAFLTKPFEFDELVDVIRERLH